MIPRCLQGVTYDTVDEVQNAANRVYDEPWFGQRWPDALEPRITDGRARRSAAASPETGRIAMPRRYRYELLLLHEIAHLALGADEGHRDEFVRVYALLIARHLGREAQEAFQDACHRKRVRWAGAVPAATGFFAAQGGPLIQTRRRVFVDGAQVA